MTSYTVHFANKTKLVVKAATFTEAAIKAVQKYPRRTVIQIVRAKDGRIVETRW